MLFLKLLEKIPFFANFTTEHKRMLAESASFFVPFKKGDVLIREGSFDNTLYIVVKGAVMVSKSGVPGEILATLPAGSVIGEIAFLTNRIRTTTVTALEDSICFAIDRKAMEELEFAIQLQFKDELINILIGHLDRTNVTLVDSKRDGKGQVHGDE
ncbi:Crp/Fnr family transcriptional regulator [Candidatus Magnetaquicoccus inordinatus]|uniref:Crp/Fnr family transcriptional regulator n=1 Tax=Candidatus Magnetaquicoccus inordinatus TaxID=2496818 RepID=UPI00102CE1E8|nr:cyclic nucleotide-binding domain-containing protein [Candidatus Magnetaquicoccus inordinatus]